MVTILKSTNELHLVNVSSNQKYKWTCKHSHDLYCNTIAILLPIQYSLNMNKCSLFSQPIHVFFQRMRRRGRDRARWDTAVDSLWQCVCVIWFILSFPSASESNKQTNKHYYTVLRLSKFRRENKTSNWDLTNLQSCPPSPSPFARRYLPPHPT